MQLLGGDGSASRAGKGRQVSYDCRTCAGEAKLKERDCSECGGTGWHPPTREPDRVCNSCARPLWFGPRGCMWYTRSQDVDAEDPICYHCLAAYIELRFARRGNRNPTSNPQLIKPKELN